MKIKKIFLISVGFISLALGAIGAVIPLLPTFPFLLVSAFCFTKSSEKLHIWFTSTNLYKNNLESYVKGTGMSKKSKVKIMITVTIFMLFGFVMMKNVPVGQMVLFSIWLIHVLYFVFGIKTLTAVSK